MIPMDQILIGIVVGIVASVPLSIAMIRLLRRRV